MYNDTKIAVRKAFELGRILFALGEEKYNRLYAAVSKVRWPTQDELLPYTERGMTVEEAMMTELYGRYSQAAVAAGFQEKHGTAMFEYMAMEQEIGS